MTEGVIFGILHYLATFEARLQDLHFLSPTMQSFVSPMEINVLSDGRICMTEETRNLSDVELLFLEHVREEMAQRMMCHIRDFRVRAWGEYAGMV